MFTTSIPAAKYNTLKWLVVFYICLILCFVLVVQYENAFIRARLDYQLNIVRLALSSVVVLFSIIFLTFFKTSDFTYAISATILIFFALPAAVMFSFSDAYDPRIFLSHNMLFFSILLISRIRIKIRSTKLTPEHSKWALLFIVVVGLIPFVVIYLPHVNLNNLFLKEIYETRAFMAENLQNLYTDYSYSWFNKFIIPCFLVFAVYYKDRISIVIGSVALIFLYLCGAHKAVFVGLLVTFILYKYDYLNKINYFAKILVGISVFSLVASLLFQYDFFMTMSIRRALLLPALMDIFYFDMFDNNHLLWSEAINGLFREYPYEVEHSYVIGEKYFRNPLWGANNGIISEGFMNAGMLGVTINILFVSFYFSILNQLDISPKFFGMFFLFIFLILSGSLTTVMWTHGGFVLILLAFLFMKNTNKQLV